jgi:hypothetical protein
LQPSHTAAGIDLAGTAESCKFRRVERVTGMDNIAAMRGLLHAAPGPIFIHAQVEADDQKRIIPSRDGYAIKARFMQASAKRG